MRTADTDRLFSTGNYVFIRRRAIVSILVLIFNDRVAAQDSTYLDDAAVRETLIEQTLKGKDWIEYYTADGKLVGKVRYFGVHAYVGNWTTTGGRVCYFYAEPRANTCSWLRRSGDRVTHHAADGKLKKDGDALRLSGNHVDAF